MLSRPIPIIPAILVVVLVLAVPAASAESQAGALLMAGIEVDDQDGRRLDAAMSISSRRGTRLDLLASRTQADLGAGDFASTHVFGQVTRDFGRLDAGIGLRYVRDEGVARTRGLRVAAGRDFAAARLSFDVEWRDTDLGSSPFTVSGAELGFDALPSVSGSADCGVQSLGYGLGVDVSRSRWSVYGTARVFDYSGYSCDVTLDVAGSRLASTRPRLFRLLSDRLLDRLESYTTTRLPPEAALLESSLAVGASIEAGARATLGVEFHRSREEFAPVESDTVLGYAELRLSGTVSVELTAGLERASGYADTTFIGLRLSSYLPL